MKTIVVFVVGFSIALLLNGLISHVTPAHPDLRKIAASVIGILLGSLVGGAAERWFRFSRKS
jgi:predicted MFS family arabinose efflux permease